MSKSVASALAEASTTPAQEEERSRSRGRSADQKRTKTSAADNNTTTIDPGQLAMMNDTLNENNTQTQRQITHISSQLHAVAKTTDRNISNLQNQQSTMKEQIQRLEKTVETQQQSQSAQRTTSKKNANDNDSDSDDERDRQIILHGFAADSDEATVTTFANKLLHDNGLANNVEKVFTFTEPSHIGVIKFKPTSAKAGFFKKMRNVTIKCPHNDEKTMSWTDNNSFEERAIHKQLGLNTAIANAAEQNAT